MTSAWPHVALYVKSSGFYGAEQVAHLIVQGAPADLRISVVGPHLEILRSVAGGRQGVELVEVPPVRHKADLASLLQLRRALRVLGPDVLHINLTDMAACLPEIFVAATLRGARIVAVEHNPFAPTSTFQRLAKSASVRLLTGHVAVSRSLAVAVADVTGEPLDAIDVIPNGIGETEPVRSELHGRLRVGVACRLVQEKGLDVLLDAIANVPGADLVIAGEGAMRDALFVRAARTDLAGRVRFVGWLDDVNDFYGSIDVYALPSRAEAMPMSILEAMHRAIPVVASDVGGISEIVVDGTALLVPVDDAPALAAALESLVQDPVLRRALGDAGFARARAEFSAATMAGRWARLYGAVAVRAPRQRVVL